MPHENDNDVTVDIPEHTEARVRQPDLAEHAEARVRQPDLAEHAEARVRQPDLAEHAEARVRQPDLAEHADARVRQPDLAEHADARVRQPDLADNPTRTGAPVQAAQPNASRGAYLLALTAVAAVTLLVFARTVGFDFCGLDDDIQVYDNPYLAGLNPAKLAHFWRHPYENLYIPLSYMVFAWLTTLAVMQHADLSVTMKLTLLNPHVFHTANIVLHTINAVLVFAILRRLTRKDVPSAFGALLFAVHPMQVESVAWISELRGLLAAAFGLGATLLYIAIPRPLSMRGVRYWLACLLFILGLLCKPSIAPLPLGLIALDIWVLGRSGREALTTAIPFLLIILPFGIITHNVQPVSKGIDAAPLFRPLIAADAVLFYLEKLFWPAGLTLDYDRTPAHVLRVPSTHFLWIVPLAAACLVAAIGRQRRWIIAAAWFSFVLVLPVLGLVPFSYQLFSTVADRYVYLPMFGPALILAMALAEGEDIRSRNLLGYGASAALVLILSVATYVQEGHWRNGLTLLAYAARMAPHSYEMHNNYGVALIEARRPADAVTTLLQAVRIRGTDSSVYVNLSGAYETLGKRKLARNTALDAIELNSANPRAYRALGHIDMDENHPADAVKDFANSVRLAPYAAYDRADYANALMAIDSVPDAIAEFKLALKLDPTLEQAQYDLGTALAGQGDMAGAEASFRRAIALLPSDAKAHGDLANVLSETGRAADALPEYRTAVALSPNNPDMHFNLGHFLLHNNDTAGAIAELQTAVRLSPDADNYDELGVAYAVAGDPQTARTEFTTALRLQPGSPTIENHLAMLSGR